MYSYQEALQDSVKYFNGDELAAKVFVDKYALRDNNNEILENTPEKTHRRLAKEFARIESKKFKKPLTEDEIFSYFDKFKCIIPQGSPIFAIGNDYQIVSASNCVHGESLVYTKEFGLIKMKDVKIGMNVLTHKNRFRKVLNHWSNGFKETYTISRTFSNKKVSIRNEQEMSRFLSVTSDHRILNSDDQWTTIEETLNKQNKQFKTPKIEYNSQIPEVFPIGFGNHILTDEDFYWICGLYLAEGSIKKLNTDSPSLYFTLNSNEVEYVQKIKDFCIKVFGTEPWVQSWEEYNFIQVNIFNPEFAILMDKIFNHGFSKKRIPEWCFGLEEKYIKSLLDGFFCGDGTNYENLDDDYNFFSIANPTLGYELGLLARNINKNCRFNFLTKGKLIKNRTISVSFSEQKEKILINKSPVSVEVFDMEVEEDHSFVAGDFICHNCFVVESPEDSYGGICKTDQELAQISKRRGGVGLDLSNLRPSGSITQNSSRTSTGIKTWMERYSNTIREVGQCLHGDSLVITSNGLKKIKLVQPEEMVWTKDGWVKVVKTFKNGKKKLFKLTTDTGFTIKCSKDHIFQTFDIDGNLTETKLEDLEAGDGVVLCRGNGSHTSSYVKLDVSDYVNSNNKPANCILPDILDEKLAYILGYSYGDGYVANDEYGDYGLELACSNDYPSIKIKLYKYINQIFDYIPRFNKGDGNLETLDLMNKTVIQFLKYNFLLKEKSECIQFPEKIINSPVEVQKAFISGYFDADGDICGSKSGYRFRSVNLKFLETIQKILSSLGILSKISFEDRSEKGWQTLYTLSVVGHTSTGSMLDFIESEKVMKSLYVSKRDCWLTPFKAKSFNIKHNNYSYCPDNSQFLSLATVNKLKDTENVNTYLLQDKIAKIEEVESDLTYDLQLESEHLFWCNGVYLHNSSRRGALMLTISVHHPDIETFITAKNNDTDVTGANISTRVTDEFLNAVDSEGVYELRFPVNSDNIFKQESAKKIWDMIVYNAWLRAEPGVLFWDNIINESLPDCYEQFKTASTNPSLRKDTLILTKDGPRRIDTLQDKEFFVYNLNHTYSKATCKLSGENQELYEIELSTGFKYYATKEHRWATSNGEKTTLELINGDKLPILKKDKVFNGTLGDREDGFLIGWFLGDGWLTKRKDNNKNQYGFIISEKDKENSVGEIILSKLKSIGFNGKWIERSKNGSIWYEINTQNSKLDDYFNKFFNPNKKDGLSKELLEQASEEFIIGLVDGYLSSDGSIDEKRQKITFVSKNEKLLKDFSEIFGFYGIRSTIRNSNSESKFPNNKNYNKKYTRNDLYISDSSSIKHFQKIFNLSLNYKQDKLIKMLTRRSNNIDYVKVKSVTKTNFKENVWDITVQDENNCFSLSHCVTHNCGEITLSPNDSCRLMAINLTYFVKNHFKDNVEFDFVSFFKVAQIAQRLMDDMVDLELEKIDGIISKIKNDPEKDEIKNTELSLWKKMRKAAELGRRTGLGITGLGDTVAFCNYKYGSDESIKFIESIYQTLKFGSYQSSVDMAKELGPFSIWEWEKEKDNPFLNRIKEEFLDYTVNNDICPIFGKNLYEDIQKYGRRNIANLTTAPTGTISILANLNYKDYHGTTSGIEPVYTWKPYTRKKKGNPNDKDFRTDSVDQNGDHWMHFNVYHKGIQAWIEEFGEENIKECPYIGSSAEEIIWTQRVKLQAAAQKHVDHSISSTVNLPNDISVEEVDKIYREAWKSGCKGITVYRDGCRTGVLVKDEPKEESIKKFDAPKRPKSLNCDIYNFSNKGSKYTVIVGLLNNDPYEVFCVADHIDKHKTGKLIKKGKGRYVLFSENSEEIELQNYLENDAENALLRMISTSLRHGSDIQFIVEQLQKTKGDLTSFTKCIARALKHYIEDGKNSSEKCECGNNLTYQEGCLKCLHCGFSKCG